MWWIMPYKQLSEANKGMYRREIEAMKSSKLQKEHEIVKLSFNRERIQGSMSYSIAQQKNIILTAQEMINDFEYDVANKVTYTALGAAITKAEQEIKRLENNIRLREEQVSKGVSVGKDRNEEARKKLRDKIDSKLENDEELSEEENELLSNEDKEFAEDGEDGQPEEEEIGQQESGDKPEA